MRKVLSIGAVLLSSTAYAADMGYPTKAPPLPIMMVEPWTGFYIGGNAGTWWGSGNALINNISVGTVNSSGGMGGVQVGAQKQYGNWVWGVETDFDVPVSGASSILPFNGQTTTLNWLGSARVKVGYLVGPQWLVYGTGGVAYGESTDTLGPMQDMVFGVGWVGGAGIQYMISPNWVAGVEYLHYDMVGPTVDVVTGRNSFITESSTATNDVVRARLDFKF